MGALQNLVPFGLVCTVKIRDFIESSKCHTLRRSHGAAGPLGLLLVETVLEIEECRGMGRACGRSTPLSAWRQAEHELPHRWIPRALGAQPS